MLKILQAKLQQNVNRELPDVQAGFRKGRGTRDQIANIRWIIEKAREFQKNIYFCLFGLGMRNKAGQRQIEFCQENALVIANNLFQQHKRGLYTWTSPDGQYQNQTDYILYSQRQRSSIHSAKMTGS